MNNKILNTLLFTFFCFIFTLIIGINGLEAKKKSNSYYKKNNSYRSYKNAKVIDGDTFKYKGRRYRIQQYNAPELGQPGSKKATKKLQNKINSGNYQWKPVAKDKYGRTIVKEKKKK